MSTSPLVQKIITEGMAHHRAGRAEAASVAFARARSMDMRSWEASHYGGMSALLLGKSEEATRLFTQAFQINPRSVESVVALGLSLLTLGQNDAAEKALRYSLRFAPGNGEILSTLGMVLHARGSIEEALDCHGKAVVALPRNGMLWMSYGTTLMDEGRVIEAFEKFDRAIKCDPSMLAARTGRAGCLFRMHRVEEAVGEYRRLLAKNPGDLPSRSHMLMALNSSATISREELFREHQLFGRHASSQARTFPCRVLQPGEPLRVAVLSADLRAHAVACFFLPLVRFARESGMELHLFSDHGREDLASEEFKRHAASWTRIAGQVDGIVEQRLLAMRPDVLLELTGHTGSNRLAMLARRVAPLQATYLGYPNTTGVSSINLRFVDLISDPEGEADTLCVEKLVRFSECAWCFEPIVESPAPRETPPDPAQILFGCFNNFTKVTDQILRQWGMLLSEVPGSRLLVKSSYLDRSEVASPLLARMRREGLDTGRVEILPHTPGATAHLELYKRVDVALDTSPYNGTTTTCEALRMGVPVVTLRGDRHVARVGASLLSAVGHSDWVAGSWDEYRSLARRLALAVPGEVQRGEALRRAMQESILMDARRQAERFWTALRSQYEALHA